MTFWITQLLNGISFGMLLFLLAAGLSLIYGLMRILNLAHGSYYILGAYVGLSVLHATASFALATVAAVALGGRARRGDGALRPAPAPPARRAATGAHDLRHPADRRRRLAVDLGR